MTLPKDYTGQVFGNLKAIERTASDDKGKARWICECSCGVRKAFRVDVLRLGKASSCGGCGAARNARGRDLDRVNYTLTAYHAPLLVQTSKSSCVCFLVLADGEGNELFHLDPTNRAVPKGSDIGVQRTLTAMAQQGLIQPQGMRSTLQWQREAGMAAKQVALSDQREVRERFDEMYP